MNNISRLFNAMLVFLFSFGLCNFIKSQELEKTILDIPFLVESKSINLPGSRYELKEFYVFLEERHFNRNTLIKLFRTLSKDSINATNVTVFTNRDMLIRQVKVDKIRIPDHPNTAEGNKIREDFIDKNFPSLIGALRATYSRNDVSEYFLYSPKSDSGQTIMVMLRDQRVFKVSDDFLFKAVKYGYLDAVRWYLTQSKKLDITDKDGLTPLMHALWLQHTEITKLLIESGAKINNIKDTDGATAFHYASVGGDIDSVNLLIGNKADIDSVDNEGRTSLMFASNNCNVSIVNQLLSLGSKVNGTDSDGKSALTHSCENKDILIALFSFGANPNLIARDGTTPIFYAVENTQINKVDMLLEKGAKVNLKDKNNKTPLAIAENLESSDKKNLIIALLKKYGAK